MAQKRTSDAAVHDGKAPGPLGDGCKSLLERDLEPGRQFDRTLAEPFERFRNVAIGFGGEEKTMCHLPRNSWSLIWSQGRAVLGLR